MALLEIIIAPDPRLKRKCEPVAKVDATTAKLMSDMLETMYEAPGIGLAAPQVAQLLESLMLVASVNLAPRTGPRDAALRLARICYDHIAGRLGVALADAMAKRGLVELDDGAAIVTGAGMAFFEMGARARLSPAGFSRQDKSRRRRGQQLPAAPRITQTRWAALPRDRWRSTAAPMKPANRGCAAVGFDLNSGWNCTATNQG